MSKKIPELYLSVIFQFSDCYFIILGINPCISAPNQKINFQGIFVNHSYCAIASYNYQMNTIQKTSMLIYVFSNFLFLGNLAVRNGDCCFDKRQVGVCLWKVSKHPFGFEIQIFTKKPQMVGVAH